MASKARELKLTNLDKVYWPDEGYTKGDMLAYYERIAKTILPYLKDRPMVLNRHPDGIQHEGFFQKQIDKHAPSWIETVDVQHAKKITTYLMVQNVETLLYVANLGCIELNPFHASVPNLNNPDYMVIDLDPEQVAFDKVIGIALSIHELLDELGVKNYCKTSGGRGLHIYVPMQGKYDFAQSQDLAHLIAAYCELKHPKLVSLIRNPKDRQKRIYIDYLRNSPHQTVAAPYCLRPKPFAPASTPLAWDEVKTGLNPCDFTIETLPDRIDQVGDLFKPVLGRGINLKKCLSSLHKILNNLGPACLDNS